MNIQDDYQQYAFLLPQPEAEVEALARTEAITKYSYDNEHFHKVLKRTYEDDYKWYLVVFKPFDKPYAKDQAWYQHRGIDAARRYFKKPQAFFITKEIDAEKTHINALVCTNQVLRDGHNTHKYKLGVTAAKDIGCRRTFLDYICKESLTRTFEKYKDYILYIR